MKEVPFLAAPSLRFFFHPPVIDGQDSPETYRGSDALIGQKLTKSSGNVLIQRQPMQSIQNRYSDLTYDVSKK